MINKIKIYIKKSQVKLSMVQKEKAKIFYHPEDNSIKNPKDKTVKSIKEPIYNSHFQFFSKFIFLNWTLNSSFISSKSILDKILTSFFFLISGLYNGS